MSKNYSGTDLFLFTWPDGLHQDSVAMWRDSVRGWRKWFPYIANGEEKECAFSKKDLCKQRSLRHLLQVSQVYPFSLMMSRRAVNWEIGHMIWMFADCSLSTVSTTASPVISTGSGGIFVLTCASLPVPPAVPMARLRLARSSRADGHETIVPEKQYAHCVSRLGGGFLPQNSSWEVWIL